MKNGTASRAVSTRPSRAGQRSTAGFRSDHFGLDQGPVILMIENYRSGLIWRLMRRIPILLRVSVAPGSRAAG